MHTYISRLRTGVIGIFLVCLLAACGTQRVGTVPRGTPDHGNGTPAVVASPTPNTGKLQNAPANATGASYAFVRENQLWTALNKAAPVQMTHFRYGDESNVTWQRPLWAPDDAHLAFIMTAAPTGSGGGGCPGPELVTNGGLYVLDTHTQQFSMLAFPSVVANASVNAAPRSDNWQYIFWEDANHLLAWYNGVSGKTSKDAGLYRYTVQDHSLRQVIPLSALGGTTRSNYQGNTPLILSIRYSSGQLFYQTVVHPFEKQSQLVINRHSVSHPETPSRQVASLGNEAWCMPVQGGPYMQPGWDISPDGEQLVVQTIVSGAAGQGVSSIQAINLNDTSTTSLFTSLSADLLGQDLALTWGPDSQTVVAAEYHLTSQQGPYSATLANPSAMQHYAPNLAGSIAWRSDSSAFALQYQNEQSDTDKPTVYLFLTGDIQGRILLRDAHEFSWG